MLPSGGAGTSAACSSFRAVVAADGQVTWAGGSPGSHSARPALKGACGRLGSA